MISHAPRPMFFKNVPPIELAVACRIVRDVCDKFGYYVHEWSNDLFAEITIVDSSGCIVDKSIDKFLRKYSEQHWSQFMKEAENEAATVNRNQG